MSDSGPMSMRYPMVIEFSVPVRIESEANRRDHWAARKRRFDAQAEAVTGHWLASTSPRMRQVVRQAGTYAVSLTRIGPRRLDPDNLAGGMKRAQDTVAKILGIDDGDKRITWVYDQAKGKPREYGLIIRISAVF